MPSFNSKFSLIKRDAVFCKKYHIDWASILCKNAFLHKIEAQSMRPTDDCPQDHACKYFAEHFGTFCSTKCSAKCTHENLFFVSQKTCTFTFF